MEPAPQSASRTIPKRSPEYGRRLARARWGAPRLWNLGDLTEDQRTAVESLVEAFRNANKAVAR